MTEQAIKTTHVLIQCINKHFVPLTIFQLLYACILLFAVRLALSFMSSICVRNSPRFNIQTY